jgi:glycosyltransferase involved in cell wall biosynthesis
MPVYNCRKYVKEAIESILAQTYRDFEFIIIDDCSTDGTSKLLSLCAKKDKRIRLLRNEENLGLTKSLNKGLKLARGELIARMDGDDTSAPDRFEKEVRFLDEHPEISLVGTWTEIVDKDGNRISGNTYPTAHEEIKRNMVRRSQICHASIVFRKSVIKAVGPYDETFRSAQDYEIFPRIMTKFRVANIPERLYIIRWDFKQNEGFTTGKRQERYALRARWRMLTRYGWPKWHIIYMIKPLVSYCVPMWFKKLILAQLHKKR